MNWRTTKLSLALCAALAATGCATTGMKDFSQMQPVALERAEVMPSEAELEGRPLRVVVFEGKDDDIDLAKAANVGVTIAREIEKHISKANVELVDREVASRLQDELLLAEMHDKAEYNGPEVADYAIVANLSQTSIGSSFTEARRWQDKKGRWHTSPASCSYRSEVEGLVQVYRMPAMEPIKTVTMSGSASSSQETSNSNCPLSRDAAASLARSAASDGVTRSRTELQNIFAPRGFVVERRDGNGQHAVKVTLGSRHGLRKGTVLKMFNVTRVVNPLSKKSAIEAYAFGNGRVSDQFGQNYAWLLIDSDTAEQVRLGQPVTLEFSKGWAEKLQEMVR